MNLKHVFLATEGPHDQAALGKLLQLSGFDKFDGLHPEFDPFWSKFITSYPSATGKVYTRIEVPSIYSSEVFSIAIFQGGGSELRKRLKSILTNNPPYHKEIHAFGVIVDTDEDNPLQITKKFAVELKPFFSQIPDIPGVVSQGKPRTGIYVLPDNMSPGTLDSVLVKCADCSYPDHKAGALKYLDELNSDYKSHWGPFHHQKALVAAITSVLSPGSTNTASIANKHTKWICEESIRSVPELRSLSAFINSLLGLHH